MNRRTSPEVECLETRQLPYAPLSVAALSAIPPLATEPEGTAERRSLVMLNQEHSGTAMQLQPGSDLSPALVAAYWPAAPQAGDVSPAPPTDPSSESDPPRHAVLWEAAKGESTSDPAARKPGRLPESDSANARSPTQKPTPNDTLTKSAEKLLPGRYGRAVSDDLLLREEKGAALSPSSRERAPTPVGQSISRGEVSHGQERENRLSLGRPEEAASGDLVSALSSRASDLSTELSSCRVGVKDSLDAKAVERVFSCREGGLLNSLQPATEGIVLPRELEELPRSYRQALRKLGSPFEGTTQLPKKHATEAGNEISVRPWYLSVVLYRPAGKPLDPSAQQGLERLCAYAWHSIHNAERIHGEKFLNPEDVVQEIYVEWRGLVGPQAEDAALCRLLEDGSKEMHFLRVAVQRVIGRTRYQQKQWAKAVAISQLAGSPPAFARHGEQERIDWEDLWQNVVSTLAPNEKQILEMRKQGRTFAEIGSVLGMARQRVCETYHCVVARLQKNYPDW